MKIKNEDELTLDEKLEMVSDVTSFKKGFSDLRFFRNGKWFFAWCFPDKIYEDVVSDFEQYSPDNPYVQIDENGKVQSATADEVEARINRRFLELSKAYLLLVREHKLSPNVAFIRQEAERCRT